MAVLNQAYRHYYKMGEITCQSQRQNVINVIRSKTAVFNIYNFFAIIMYFLRFDTNFCYAQTFDLNFFFLLDICIFNFSEYYPFFYFVMYVQYIFVRITYQFPLIFLVALNILTTDSLLNLIAHLCIQWIMIFIQVYIHRVASTINYSQYFIRLQHLLQLAKLRFIVAKLN